MEERDLSRRVRVALEKALLSDADAAAARQRERVDALDQRVEALAEETRGSIAAVQGEIRALREAHAQGMRQFERRLAAAEAGRREAGATGRKPAAGVRERRLHPQLVTREPAPDDEDVYGPAWPLIDEWRRLRAGHPGRGSGVSWLVRERAHPGAGGGHAGRARADAAAGHAAPGRLDPEERGLLAQADAGKSPGGAHPGAVAAVGSAHR